MGADGCRWVRIGGTVRKHTEEHGNEVQGGTGGRIYVWIVALVAGKFPDFATLGTRRQGDTKMSRVIGDGFGWGRGAYWYMGNTVGSGGGVRMSD